MRLGVGDHAVDLVLVQAGRRRDRDLLLLRGAEILRGDVQDAVGVDVERHLDLGHPARSRRKSDQMEHAEELVVARHLALALENLDLDRRLVVCRGREDFGLLRRNGRVALDQLRHDASERLDAERERRDVEQQEVFDVSGEDPSLDRGADRYHLVRVHALVRLFAEQLLHELLDSRHAGLAAHENDLVDVLRLEPGVLQRLTARSDRSVHDLLDELLEFGARQLQLEVLGARGVRRDEGQIHLGLHHVRKLDLGLLRGFLETLHRHRILREIDALVLLELRQDPIDDALVDVVAAEVGVAIGRLDLDHSLPDFEDRDVERASAEVVHRDRFVLLLVEPVSERRGGRFVDQPFDRQPRDLAGVLRRLALRVIEVRGHGDDRARDLLSEIGLGRFLQLAEDHRGDLGWRVFLGARLHADVPVGGGDDGEGNHFHLLVDLGEFASHEPLDREHRVGWVRDRLPFRDLSDEPLATLRKRHHGGRRPVPLGVGDDDRVPAFHHGHARVGGTEVDTDDLAH